MNAVRKPEYNIYSDRDAVERALEDAGLGLLADPIGEYFCVDATPKERAESITYLLRQIDRLCKPIVERAA